MHSWKHNFSCKLMKNKFIFILFIFYHYHLIKMIFFPETVYSHVSFFFITFDY